MSLYTHVCRKQKNQFRCLQRRIDFSCCSSWLTLRLGSSFFSWFGIRVQNFPWLMSHFSKDLRHSSIRDSLLSVLLNLRKTVVSLGFSPNNINITSGSRERSVNSIKPHSFLLSAKSFTFMWLLAEISECYCQPNEHKYTNVLDSTLKNITRNSPSKLNSPRWFEVNWLSAMAQMRTIMRHRCATPSVPQQTCRLAYCALWHWTRSCQDMEGKVALDRRDTEDITPPTPPWLKTETDPLQCLHLGFSTLQLILELGVLGETNSCSCCTDNPKTRTTAGMRSLCCRSCG